MWASMGVGGMGGCQRRAMLFLFPFLLQMCSATVLDCRSTGNNPMLFSISDHQIPPGAECDYWWNRGDIILATKDYKTELVMRHNSSSLETSECLPDVSWTQQCSQSQKLRLMDFSANCSTTCAENSPHGDSPTIKPKEKQSNASIGVIAGIVVPIMLIGLITIFLLYKYKDSIPRILHCSLFGQPYRAGRRENNEPGVLHV
ncbi:PREDICTED: uncharacterized protein LOC106918215 [Poecilia mexicana]|uniref:uncharacterized protein LOC106918215 n=1 Tax=Poecilia mexicana TaxID=48701 RepID=UPI00072E6B88|nr:PREDICTED: uncharacterized protein LOC106918215 [Poecilia mexicana]XP_014843275.1 PREDICTED: uncharacterized protein LOC106918215 [Poecilia mexicana]